MDITSKVHEQRDPVAAEALATAKLIPVYQSAGLDVPTSYPIQTADVLRLFTALDYRCDGDFVLSLCNAGTLSVPMVNGRREWSALDIWALWAQLEGRRRWKPTQRHVHKMSALERMQLLAEQAGEAGISDLDKFDIETLVMLLEDAESRDVRHALRVALMAKLRSEGNL